MFAMRSRVVHRWLVLSAVATAVLAVTAAPAAAQPPAAIFVSFPEL
jgi:hypothetical protein